MTRMTYKTRGKQSFERRLAAGIVNSYNTTRDYLNKRGLDGRPGVDLMGLFDLYADDYCYNTEWASKRQINDSILNALKSAYHLTEDTDFRNWNIRNQNEL